MLIRSVPNRLVRDPATCRVVGDDPITINSLDPHWVRLLADGDVVEAPGERVSAPAEEKLA